MNELPVARQVADNLRDLWAQRRSSAKRPAEDCTRAGTVSSTGEMILKIQSGPGKRLAERTRTGAGRILHVSMSSWLARRLP